MKTDFSKVLWTDEMRVTLDGPDGWARGWVAKGREAPIMFRRQKGGSDDKREEEASWYGLASSMTR